MGSSIVGDLLLKFAFIPGASVEEKQALATALGDLGKHAANSSKILAAAEMVLKGVASHGEAELIEFNIQKLKQTSEEAEEVPIETQHEHLPLGK